MMVAGCLAGIAAILSMWSTGWCKFVDYKLTEGQTVNFGMWRYESFYVAADSEYIYKIDTCRSYSDNVDMDSKWKAAQAFSVIAPIWGIIVAFATCALPRQGLLAGGLLMLATLWQGLVFLFFKSDACKKASENPLFAGLDPLPTAQQMASSQAECSMGSGARVAISATVFFFVAALMAVGVAFMPDEDGGMAREPAAEKDMPDQAVKVEEGVEPTETQKDEAHKDEGEQVGA